MSCTSFCGHSPGTSLGWRPFPPRDGPASTPGPGKVPLRLSLWTDLTSLRTPHAETVGPGPPSPPGHPKFLVPQSQGSSEKVCPLWSMRPFLPDLLVQSWPHSARHVHDGHGGGAQVPEWDHQLQARLPLLGPTCQGLCSSPPSRGSRRKGKGLLLALGQPGVSLRLSSCLHLPLQVL